jgi:hypothetical protein
MRLTANLHKHRPGPALFGTWINGNGQKETIPFFRPPLWLYSVQIIVNDTVFPLLAIGAMEPANCKCSNKGRNLVVCIDGTSNQFGTKVRICTFKQPFYISIDFRPVHRTRMSLNCTARLKKWRIRTNSLTTTAALAHTRNLLGSLSST